MTKTIAPPNPELEEQAMLITSEIFNRINQYTNDSALSKFFLTDEIATTCYSLAGAFAALTYTPSLEPEDIEGIAMLSFIYALMTYGFNIYLKEHSLITNGAPYTLPDEKKRIKAIERQILLRTEKGELESTPLADTIITLLSNNMHEHITMEEFILTGHRLNKKKFFEYNKLSLYWGYNFAKELLKEKTNRY